MTCEEIEELLGAYALGALPEEERTAVEAHLAQCSDCVQQVREFQEVVDFLPLAVPPVEPSPQLKNRVMSAIQATLPAQSGSSQTTAPRTEVYQPRLQALPRREEQRELLQPRPPRRRWSTPLLAAIAALLFVLVGGMTLWNISLQQQLSGLTPVTYTIRGTASNPGATGEITYIPRLHMTAVVMRGLSATSGTQVYQGWLLQGKQPRSIGLLNVQNGVGTLSFEGDINGFDSTAISLEPGAQATPDTPKGPIVAVGTLSG